MTTPLIRSLTPRLPVSDVGAAIDFYARAFGAVEQERFDNDGTIVHALIMIDGHPVALKDGDDVDRAPDAGGPSVLISLTVSDADAVAARLVDAGAREIFALGDRDYGRRDGRFGDPFGHQWIVSQPLDQEG